MSDKPHAFQQQFNITTAGGSSIIYGLGNMPRSRFTLQVTGNDGSWLAAQAAANNPVLNSGTNAGLSVNPTSWNVVLNVITDLMNGTGSDAGVGSPILNHVSGSNINGSLISVDGENADSLQVVWSNVVLGPANNILVTITAD